MNITILTGAGASVQFDNPTTIQFKEQLRSEKQSTKLIESLLAFKKYPDIEYVLEFLKDIRVIQKMHASEFLEKQEFSPDQVNPPFPIREIFGQYLGIERHIMYKLFEAYQINQTFDSLIQKFYGGFFEIIKSHCDKITIGTTNYDLAIERFCELEPTKFTCCDGFKVSGDRFIWAPHLFDKSISSTTDTPIELLKIHGSLNWIDSGGNIEKRSKFEFIPTKEGQENTLIAPILSSKDYESRTPFDILLKRFEDALKKSDICIVIGSSFRDGIIKNNMISFLEEGKHLIIVSPSCYQNYATGLRDHDSSDVGLISWAKQRALQENGKISWIPLSIKENNTKEVLLEIKNKIDSNRSE